MYLVFTNVRFFRDVVTHKYTKLKVYPMAKFTTTQITLSSKTGASNLAALQRKAALLGQREATLQAEITPITVEQGLTLTDAELIKKRQEENDPRNTKLLQQLKNQEKDAQASVLAAMGGASVTFDVMPNVSESGGTNWEEIADIRAPSSILIYTGTPARTFQIEAQFISRTVVEAALTEKKLNILRAWRMPQSSALAKNASITIPDIILLSGYGAMFKNIPVVMTSLSINLSNETDILKVAATGTSIPINIPVSISLKECHNTDNITEGLAAINSFDINAFRSGTLESW